MSLDQESHQSFASSLSTENSAEYWKLIGRIDTLPADDEMRLFVDVLTLHARGADFEADEVCVGYCQERVPDVLTWTSHRRIEEVCR